jgi:hypothetical protein
LFKDNWTVIAAEKYSELEASAKKAFDTRKKSGKTKSSRIEGLFKQVDKAIDLLLANPRHPSLVTHKYSDLSHIDPKSGKEFEVFEAYAQNKTPGAYRIFWSYGPGKGEITIVNITPHP